MKKVFMAPRYQITTDAVPRWYISSNISDFLLSQNFQSTTHYYPITINNSEEAQKYAQICIQEVDGIILQGGNDIHPSFYKEKNLYSSQVDIFRDLFELSLVKSALENNKSIFGICRGMQVINVALGGNLHQRLKVGNWQKHITYANESGTDGQVDVVDLIHSVKITSNGVLSKSGLEKEIWVNTIHYQGIKQLGANLTIEAVSEDDLAEAISWEEKNILGVQWHPELDLSQKVYNLPLKHWLNNL